MERDVQVAVPGGPTLPGILVVPPEPAGVVLFAHGSGSGRLSPRNRFVADALERAGFATLRIDLLTDDEAAEEFRRRGLSFDIPLLAERLLGAAGWLAGEGETEGLPRALYGASTGAAAALLAAARLGGEVQAVVSRGGRPDLAAHVLPEVRAPTLLIVGERDYPVIPLNRDAFLRLRTEKELAIVPGAGHLFEEPGALEEVARLTVEWIGRHVPRG